MRAFFYRAYILPFLFFVTACHSQTGQPGNKGPDRQPAVAGSFYPADKTELLKMVEGFFREAPDVLNEQPLAVILPHAGYIFSGGVAASAIKQIDRDKKFDHVFIIGSSHTMYFEGASVFPRGNFVTPLGKVPVDTLASWLDDHYAVINGNTEPHNGEHCLEVELPLLQYWMKNPFAIIPIIIGGESKATAEKLADALRPFFNDRNLFVISSDFSHYPDYSDAIKSDTFMANAISTNSPGKFLDAKARDENAGTPNLLTALCGWTSVLTLLDITEKQPGVTYRKILYRNSGDSEYGDKNRVVGYNAFCIMRTGAGKAAEEFRLTDSDKVRLLKIARETMEDYVRNDHIPVIDEKTIPSSLMTAAGAFVTITENGQLRGCIGNMESDKPLYKLVQAMAIATATRDYRFTPVTTGELQGIEVEISVLTPMKKIKSIDEIVLGKHGIYIKKGANSGTFLPQVATETGWTKEEFLGHCAQDKAFIGWNGWKNAEIYTYEALVFSEKEFHDQLK